MAHRLAWPIGLPTTLIRLGIMLAIIMEAMTSFLNNSLYGLKMRK